LRLASEIRAGVPDDLTRLSQLAATIASTRDFRRLLRPFARRTARACKVDRCSIFLWKDQHLVPVASEFASGKTAPPPSFWLAGTPLQDVPVFARVLRDRTPVVLRGPGTNGAGSNGMGPTRPASRWLAVLPLHRLDRSLGVMQLDNVARGAVIGGWQVTLARSLASALAIAIESSAIAPTVRTRLKETATLLRVARALGSTLDLAEVTRRISREAARAVVADSAGIYNEDGLVLHPLAGYHLPKEYLAEMRQEHLQLRESKGFFDSLKTVRGSIWSDDVMNHPAFSHEIFKQFPMQSILLTPLEARGERVGMLVCAWWKKRRRLRPAELRLMEAIASQAAVAIINSRLYAEAEEAAVDRERVRIDQLLHDTLSQTLFGLGLKIERCLHYITDPDIRSRIEAIKADAGLMMFQLGQVFPAESAE
jgi:GAF domain-containing protein